MSSKRGLRRKACQGKKAHATLSAATAAAKKTGPDVHPYRCPHCTAWHVGHARSVDKGTYPLRNERRW